MKLFMKKEVTNLADGTYNGSISHIFPFIKDGTQRFGIVFDLDDDDKTEFTYFTTAENLVNYPWVLVLKALNTDDTDDLIGKNYEFTIKNNTKNDKTFSNITKITVK